MAKHKKNKDDSDKKLSKKEMLDAIENLPEHEIFDPHDFMEFLTEFFKDSPDIANLEGQIESLKKLRHRLKEKLIKDVNLVLLEMKDLIDPNEEKYDDIIALIIRHNRFLEMNRKGLIKYEDSGVEHRSIVNGTLMIIQSLENDHLKEKFS